LRLSLVGVSHHVAPVELRERVALTPERAASLARALGDAVCLSTCNRTEVYLAGEDGSRALTSLEELAGETLRSVAYRMDDERAAEHLFRVSAGLDSLIPGESEILGQVRAAYHAASPGPLLDRVFRQALQLGKRVRTETAIAESPASVPAAAAALAAQVFGDLRGRRVLLVGAGTIGRLAATNLWARGATIAYVANRSRDAALELSDRFGATPIGLDELTASLGEVDVVLSSTSAPDVVITPDLVPARRRHPLFFIDIAVPRDVDPSVHDLGGCFLYDIDDLEAVVAETLTGRRAEAERAEQLVVEEAERFREWKASLDAVPAITALRAYADAVRTAELERLPPLPAKTRARIEAVTAQLLNKLLHLPTVRMKEAAAHHDDVSSDAIGRLFGLDGAQHGDAPSPELAAAVADLRARGAAVRAGELERLPPLPDEARAQIDAVTAELLDRFLPASDAGVGGRSDAADARAVRRLFGLDEAT
jgi:glutamyl-tRNA reductase